MLRGSSSPRSLWLFLLGVAPLCVVCILLWALGPCGPVPACLRGPAPHPRGPVPACLCGSAPSPWPCPSLSAWSCPPSLWPCPPSLWPCPCPWGPVPACLRGPAPVPVALSQPVLYGPEPSISWPCPRPCCFPPEVLSIHTPHFPLWPFRPSCDGRLQRGEWETLGIFALVESSVGCWGAG